MTDGGNNVVEVDVIAALHCEVNIDYCNLYCENGNEEFTTSSYIVKPDYVPMLSPTLDCWIRCK